MAPMTRSGVGSIPPPEGLRPPREKYREASWQFVGADSRHERDLSEEPPSSYDEDTDMLSRDGYGAGNDGRQLQLEGPEDHEDILHPLREAANRVGREVEKFAEVLDGYNPLRATDTQQRHEMTADLIERYHEIAKETLGRLREQHEGERLRSKGRAWRKMWGPGLKIANDTDELDSDYEDSPNAEFAQQTTLEDLERWEQEAQTWDLLARLVEVRHPAHESEIVKVPHRSSIHPYSTEQELWDDFLQSDELAIERKTVLEWLKDTAQESGEDINEMVKELHQNAERGDIIAHGWIHTKTAIKQSKRNLGAHECLDPESNDVKRLHLNSSKTEILVSQLDPDAMARQGRKLQIEDQYFERAIWLGCYEMLRRGTSPDDIREWCMDRTQIWRAVSMASLPNERMKNTDGNDVNHDPADPSSWRLWRRMCFALARQGGAGDYERAVYGILSGDVASVEHVCRSWDDFLFTHYSALLQTQFDNHLQTHYSPAGPPISMSNFGVFDAVQFHGDPKTAAERLIEKLESDVRTKEEALKPMKMIQGVLLANKFPAFIYQQGSALSKFANAANPSNLIPMQKYHPDNIEKYVRTEDHDSLRVLTHVLLAYRGLGVDFGGASTQTTIDNVIVAYISFLKLAGKEELIPLYCSQLSGKRRYATLSRCLIDITDHEQRVTQIKLMRGLGLDVQTFVTSQSRFLNGDYPDNPKDFPAAGQFRLLTTLPGSEDPVLKEDFCGIDDNTERTDMLLIRSLEWYLLVDGLWSETFNFGSKLFCRFLKNMQLPAARMLVSRVSSNAIALSKTHAILDERLDFNGLEEEGEEDLTDVLDGISDQKRLLKKFMLAEAKNFRELEALVEVLDNIETISGIENIMREQDPSQHSAGYKLEKQAVVKTLMYISGFVPTLAKGWLLTVSEPSLEEQFVFIRETYLPETIMAFIRVLEFSGRILTRDFLMECMDVASVIADEDSDLLPLFASTGKMQDLVKVVTYASKTLLLMTSSRGSAATRSRKLRAKGWTQHLWSVRQPSSEDEI